MTALKLPVSTSQAIVGAILGVAAINRSCDFTPLRKIITCWIATPPAAMLISIVLYLFLRNVLAHLRWNVMKVDTLMRIGLITVGCYGAYALGANNVGNITGVIVSAGVLNQSAAALLGAAAIGLGVHTFSRRVMYTVGARLVPLGSISAFVALTAHSITLHVFALHGVPVSSSQAIVGAVLGIGLVHGARTINNRTLLPILGGWFATPAAAFILVYVFLILSRVR